MASIHVYILDKSVMPQLKTVLQPTLLDLQELGPPTSRFEGIEQNWKCCDKSGDLFFFGTCEVNEKNGLRLKAGTFCLIPGPGARGRKRNKIADAFKRFERALAALGVQPIPHP